jgi:hypothetical protein
MAAITKAAPFARIIPGSRRFGFLPRHFGRHMMTVEQTVYALADEMIEGYTGGLWKYAEAASNGAPFMIPPAGDKYGPTNADRDWLHVAGDCTGFAGNVSPEAAGIIVTLFAVCQAWNAHPDYEILGDAYGLLREAAAAHPERESIFHAID